MAELSPRSHLNTKQFHDALLRYIDESKPDSLLKKQMLNLGLEWRHDEVNTDQILMVGEEETISTNKDHAGYNPGGISGTLTLSSDYISISVHVRCYWRIQDDVNNMDVSSSSDGRSTVDTIRLKRPLDERSEYFQNEFYFRLGASAKMNKSGTNNADNKKIETTDGKNHSMDNKLQSGMIKRLSTDPWIRQILVNDDAGKSTDGKLICEAFIQQNETNTTKGHAMCEERVNAQSGSIEGTRHAILSHCEDNLDMLEFLLNMPYLPRDGILDMRDFSPKGKDIIKTLARRAYLRILEDAMFDACEKEGEDDMVDDLNLCDEINEQDLPNHDNSKEQKIVHVKKKNKV